MACHTNVLCLVASDTEREMASDKAGKTESTARKRSLARRFLRAGLVLITLFVVLTALTPMILSQGIANGIVERAIAGHVNGDVTVREVKLGWFSGQRVEGLSISSPDGDAVINADALVDQGLGSLIFSGGEYGRITVSGDATIIRHEDGTTGIDRLFPNSPPSDRDPRGRKPTDRAKRSSPDLIAEVVIDGLSLQLNDLASNQTFALRDLKGTAAINLGGESSLSLAGVTDAAGRSGTLSIDATGRDLMRPGGAFDMPGATLKVDAEVTALPVALIDAVLGTRGRLSATLGSTIDSLKVACGGAAANATGAVTMASPMTSVTAPFSIHDGALVIDESSPAGGHHHTQRRCHWCVDDR